MISRCLPLFAAFLVVAGAVDAKGEKKGDKDKFQGEWGLASMEMRGKVIGDEKRKDWKLIVKGDEWVQSGGGQELKMKVKFVDSAKTPKEIDFQFTEPGGEVWLLKGIYKIDRDKLTVCKRTKSNEDRPSEFKSGDSTALMVFEKAKKK